MDKYDVSICCLCYNQAIYIEKAINSFLAQQSDWFSMEILIHDDCSTDGTIQILKEFENNNDNIRVLYEEENQYSKGNKILPILFNEAKGKYIAICEGDDFWNNDLKIATQLRYMMNNEECTLCVHDAYLVNRDETNYGRVCNINDNRIMPLEEVVSVGGAGIPTCSLFFKRADVLKLPKEYHDCPVCDYPLQIFLAEKGYCYYYGYPWGNYRVNSIGSVTTELHKDKTTIISFRKKFVEMYDSFDKKYDFKYHDAFQDKKNRDNFEIFLLERNFKNFFSIENMRVYLQLSLRRKVTSLMNMFFPSLTIKMKKLLTKN